MIALRLVRLIEDHSDELAEGLLKKFKVSSLTRDMSKVPDSELRDRVYEILNNLGEWLLYKREDEIERRYRELGARRSSQQVSLSDYCWAIVLTKEHVWEFLQKQGMLRGPLEIFGEMELLRLMDQFFDRALCYATEGYEQTSAAHTVA
jgi:hypothetical protein